MLSVYFTVFDVECMTTEEWVVPINKYALFQFVKQNSDHVESDEYISSVIEHVLESHNDSISMKYVDKSVINRLRSTIREMLGKYTLSGRKGGRQQTNLLDKWTKSTYSLRLDGIKRKMEQDLEWEAKRRKIVENELTNAKNYERLLKKRNRELAAQLIRRAIKNQEKCNSTPKRRYSKSYRRKKKHILMECVKEKFEMMKEEGYNPKQIEVCDLYGNAVKFLSPDFEPSDKSNSSIDVEKGNFP